MWSERKTKRVKKYTQVISLTLSNTLSENFHNFPDRVIKVKYEDLKLNPIKELKKLYKFCNLKWDIQVEDFILESTTKHEKDPYSVFKSQNQTLTLPKNIVSSINQYSQKK